MSKRKTESKTKKAKRAKILEDGLRNIQDLQAKRISIFLGESLDSIGKLFVVVIFHSKLCFQSRRRKFPLQAIRI